MSVQGTLSHSGDNGGRDPPVLIPNSEVKPTSAEGTWLDTTWESRTSPVPMKERVAINCSLFLLLDNRYICYESESDLSLLSF